MRYFLSTELISDSAVISDLLSIALVSGDGRQLYIENSDADLSKASQRVIEDVVSNFWSRQTDKHKLEFNPWIRDGVVGGLMRCDEIARKVRDFCDPQIYGNPEFWGYHADYDWAAFCHLFGTMSDLPERYPAWCRDLKWWYDHLGISKLPVQQHNENHALATALLLSQSWDRLRTEADRQRYTDLIAAVQKAIPCYETAASNDIRAFNDFLSKLYAAIALSFASGKTLLIRRTDNREALVLSVHGIVTKGFSTFIQFKLSEGVYQEFEVASILEIEEV